MKNNDEQFDELMTAYLSGTLTDSGQAELISLLQTDNSYKERYKSALKAHAVAHIPALEKEKDTNYKLLMKRIGNTPPVLSTHNRFGVLLKVAAAALIILSVSLSGVYIYNNSKNTYLSDYETMVPLGSQTRINLPDGTVAWLNSGSILKYKPSFGQKTRDVYLTGEGYFEVTKDASRPFLVHTSDIHVKVLGTTFNIRSYLEDNFIQVDLIEGLVDVSLNNTGVGQPVRLNPDEKAFYNKQSGQLTTSQSEATKSALWTTGKLSFVNASLVDIAKDLERKYNVKIRIESEQMKKEYFSGSINLNLSLYEILNYIDVDKKYKLEQNGNTIILKNK